jgi:hypothetical protein
VQSTSNEILDETSTANTKLSLPDDGVELENEDRTGPPNQEETQSPISTPESQSFTPTRETGTLAAKPAIRRTPSKVPGDYDPVTGYYRRKSEADDRIDDDEQVGETRNGDTSSGTK